MKTIEIEKRLELEDIVDLIEVEIEDHLEYKKENEGIRCVGPCYLKGRYTNLNEVKFFHEKLEFDIFASYEKLEKDFFKLVYTGYEYSVKEKGIITLLFNVEGVKEEKEVVEEEEEISAMEELLEDLDQVTTSYCFVVVKENDTYESIAERYDIDVNVLKEVNNHKVIQEKDLIVLPTSIERKRG